MSNNVSLFSHWVITEKNKSPAAENYVWKDLLISPLIFKHKIFHSHRVKNINQTSQRFGKVSSCRGVLYIRWWSFWQTQQKITQLSNQHSRTSSCTMQLLQMFLLHHHIHKHRITWAVFGVVRCLLLFIPMCEANQLIRQHRRSQNTNLL